MIDQLHVGIEHVGFRRVVRAESIRNTIAFVLQNREGQSFLSRVRFHFRHGLSHIRVDSDNIDALRSVILRQLFHAIVVSVGYGTARGDENQDGAFAAGQ